MEGLQPGQQGPDRVLQLTRAGPAHASVAPVTDQIFLKMIFFLILKKNFDNVANTHEKCS